MKNVQNEEKAIITRELFYWVNDYSFFGSTNI